MTQGWKNLRTKKDVRAREKHHREVGYSDGYGMQLARSLEANYQVEWRRGRAARRAFDQDNAT